MQTHKTILIFLILSLGILGCEKKSNKIERSSYNPTSGLPQTEPNTVENCLSDENYNACFVWKNPVAYTNKYFYPPILRGQDITEYQTHAVNLNIDPADTTLSGSFFNIKKASVDPSNVANDVYAEFDPPESGNYKFNYVDNPDELSAFNTYYVLNLQEQVMNEQVGGFYLSSQNLEVQVSSRVSPSAFFAMGPVFAYFPQMILLPPGTTNAPPGIPGFDSGLNSDVVAHEMGHANLFYATSQLTTTPNSTNISCFGSSICCATADGCFSAIHEGLGDFHSNIMFPENTAIGETYANSILGIEICGTRRNMDDTIELEGQTLYDRCVSLYGEAPIHGMGVIYASIWNAVRKNYAINSTEWLEIGQIFHEHMSYLDNDDTFVTAYDKIVTADTNLFSTAKYKTDFYNEYTKRGYSVTP